MKYINSFKNFKSEKIIIEVIDYNVDIDILNEKFNYGEYEYDDFDGSGKKRTNLTPLQISKLKQIEERLNEYLNNINGFDGIYIHKNGLKIKKTFNIILTKHYIQKFIRKDIEDPSGKKGFVNPDIREGVDLIYNNRDTLSSYLFSGILLDNDNVLVIMKSSSGYKLIMIIEEIEKNKKYNLIFKTQMKGKTTFTKNKKIIKLPPYPKKPS